ncbi:hypothetical protein Tco_0757572 [Tanacetum coccineum]
MVKKFILKFHHLFDHNEEEEIEKDDNPNETDNVLEIFKIEGNLVDFETPLCEAFYEFNYLLKIETDLFTYDIQNFKTYDEYERKLNTDIAKGIEESWSENGMPYQLCDHICKPCRFKNGETKWPTCTSDIDGFCNGRELPRMVRVGSMTYFQDHRRFEMMKYSFNDDKEYITIKESEYLNHSKDSLDAYRELLRLIDEGWVVTTSDDE